MAKKGVYVAAGSKPQYWAFGDRFRFLITGDESGGSYSALEVVVTPDNGPGPHTHSDAEEQFYVLEGTLTFQVGDQTFQASAGDFIHIPRGTVHSFTNSHLPAKLLAIYAPAGDEKLFLDHGQLIGEHPAPATPDGADE